MRPLVGPRKKRRARLRVCNCLAHPAFDWTREIRFLETENQSFIESKYDRTTTLMDTFLEDQHYSPRVYYEKPVFVSICPEEILSALYWGRIPTSAVRVAWVDERCPLNGPREGNGPVSTAALYKKMTSKRFGHPDEPDANTRRIYVPGPDSWTIAALILTASTIVAPALRDFILGHFTSQRRFRAAFTDGPFAFRLEFHVPYFALRKHRRIPNDSRKRPDGTPCRRTTDLSFLIDTIDDAESTHVSYCLHEVQTSLLIVGNSNAVWAAYLFTDTYHIEGSKETNHEDLSSYQQRSDEDAIFYDPLTMGQHDANLPIWDPREYYCLIVRIRLGHVKEEWATMLNFVMQSVEAFKLNVPSFLEPTGLGSAETQSRAIETAYDWITNATRLLQRLTVNLHKVIQTWSSFAEDNIIDFTKGNSNRLKISLQNISACMDELREILADLDDLMQRVKNLNYELELYVPVAGNRAIGLHHWTFTILLFMSPAALSSGIMQSEIVYFHPPILCFLVLSIIIGIAMFAVKPLSTSLHLLFQPKMHRQQSHKDQSPSDMALTGVPWNNNDISLPSPTFGRTRRRAGM